MDIGLILAQASSDPTILETIGRYAWMIFSVGAGLTFVIFVHELGHFLVAKACGVKCEKFYVGFDFLEFKLGPLKIPRSLVKFQWGETEYGLGSLPLGGYVKMLGQDDDPRNAEREAARTKVIQEGTAAEGLVPGQTVEGTTPAGQTVMLDPRSYPAKPIPARMAIISAGVIMNLIFAVILAAIAFRMGVPEVPAVIGQVAPGSPAWAAGIEPGSKIIQFGKGGEPYEHLRFMDLTTAVILNGYDRELPMLIRGPDGQEKWYEIRPSDRVKKTEKRPQVGVGPAQSRDVLIRPAELKHLGPQVSPELNDRDEVVRVAGQSVATGSDLATVFAQNPTGPIKLTIERTDPLVKEDGKSDVPKTIEVTLQPKPMREIGAVMKIGPITAIRAGSPAADAGFQVEDLIVEVDGEPVGDPLSLSQRLVPQEGSTKPVEFVVLRQDRQGKDVRRTISVTPELPDQYNDLYVGGGPTSLEPIGVAFKVTNEVAEVLPASPAEKAGLAPGDKLTRVEFPGGKNAQRESEITDLLGDIYEPIDIDDNMKSWTYVHTRLQWLLPENEVKLTWQRGGKAMSEVVQPRDSATFFDESRGLALYGRKDTHRAESWGRAFQLGFRETTERLKEVVFILTNLVTGRLSPTNLSGPLGIVYVAGSFADQGIPTLLIFLTMLSANLAILNFLPIPALDGGHMLFLLAEWIRGKPVDERLQIRLTIFGVVCLLSLMVFATAMDVGRFAEMFQNWFG